MIRSKATVLLILLCIWLNIDFAVAQHFPSPAFAQTLSSPPTTASSPSTPQSAVSSSSTPKTAAEKISERDLKSYLEFITSDTINGRVTPSKGLDLTAQFIAKNLSTWKLKPRGDGGTFFQKIPLQQQRINISRTAATINGQSYKYGNDFIAPALAPGTASGPLVYVGHGWVIPHKKINAYEGVDVRDKVMVVAGGGAPPEGMTPQDYGRSQHPYEYAQRNNAKGVILLPHFRTLSEWESHKRQTLVSGNITLVGERRPATPRGFYEGAVLQSKALISP